jgi:mannose-6-phosphate isomerase-like protein (cupin superfamily)
VSQPNRVQPRLTPETVETRVYDPMDFVRYSPEAATLTMMYGNDPDISLAIWSLEPGQENPVHVHADYGQTFVVLCGSGILLRERGQEPLDVRAGQIIINPRRMPHGLRNTGTERLSYLAISSRPVEKS